MLYQGSTGARTAALGNVTHESNFKKSGVVVAELPELMTPEETAEWLNMSVESLSQNRYLRDEKTIPYVKVGKRVRYIKDDVIAYVRANRISTGA